MILVAVLRRQVLKPGVELAGNGKCEKDVIDNFFHCFGFFLFYSNAYQLPPYLINVLPLPGEIVAPSTVMFPELVLSTILSVPLSAEPKLPEDDITYMLSVFDVE